MSPNGRSRWWPGRMVLACAGVLVVASAIVQIAPARTWPELKEAVQERVNRQAYPLTGMDARINPEGGYIGPNKAWADLRIMRGVVAPWFARQVKK